MNKKLGRLLYPQTWVYFVVMGLFALATLLMEQYINGEVTRPELVEYIKNMKIAYPNYEKRK